MNFNVPQFIDIEDTILGPLTLKQFLLLIAAGAFIALLWWAFKLWFVILIGGPIIAAILASIFIKINDRPLPKIFSAWFNFQTKPRFYIWKKDTKN
ncbi:MAG: PrgI family protein [Candidatus Portnoybacteria bacterium]|nr:PrgI family protein [Candidatus Portnoybacteria bacterium]MDD4982727.1 PrgI family protein [Candidatus Portnoybacteria bacterium]